MPEDLLEKLREAYDVLREGGFAPSSWSDLLSWPVLALMGLLALLALIYVRRIMRLLFRSRHGRRKSRDISKLNNGDPTLDVKPQVVAHRREQARKIVTTSSTPTIAGYEIVEQLEAVYVDGYNRPEDALEALKAAAAMKGGNAVISVRQQREAVSKCAAWGDAAVVRKV